MQIFTKGRGEKQYAPDQIIASVTFNYHADTYDEALKGGVEKVKSYVDSISGTTDFKPEDFKTRAYSVQERFHMNRLDPKTEADLSKNLQKRISDGFFFTQYAALEFDYDKMRLAKLLATSSKIPEAPMLHIDFALKDIESKKRELIPIAYEDAKKKAEVLATAAGKNLRDCISVEIDHIPRNEIKNDMMFKESAFRGAPVDSFEQQIKNIDETFKPDDISLSKEINCVWRTDD